MNMRTLFATAFLLGATVIGVSAQDAAPPTPPPAPPSTELVFEREVFVYPSFDRRNPFVRLSANAEGGPRFEQIALRTIIFSSNPQSSLAIFNAGGNPNAGAGGDVAAEDYGETRRLRRGESWGNMRLIEIQRDRVVVEVSEYGLTSTHTMMIPRAGRQGGS